MKPVMVCMPSRGSRLKFFWAPAASATIIVSPIARDMPSTMAAATPEMAAGSTTRSVVCIRLAPIASEPWRSAIGTAENESSASEAMVGTIITPRTRPAARALVKPTSMLSRSCRMLGVTKESAKNP